MGTEKRQIFPNTFMCQIFAYVNIYIYIYIYIKPDKVRNREVWVNPIKQINWY